MRDGMDHQSTVFGLFVLQLAHGIRERIDADGWNAEAANLGLDLFAHSPTRLEDQEWSSPSVRVATQERTQHRILNGVLLVCGQRRKGNGNSKGAVTVPHASDRAGEAHGLFARCEVNQHAYEMARPQITFAGYHHASGGQILERVLADAIATLEQKRTPVEIHPVVITSIALCPDVSHCVFSLPRPDAES